MRESGRVQRAPLGGCDCYLLALDELMQRSGQGRHVGVTWLELDKGFSVEAWREAVQRFAGAQPLLQARLRRRFPLGVPFWQTVPEPPQVMVHVHAAGADMREVASDLLKGEWKGRLRFDVRQDGRGGTILLMSWSHLIFDARGVELMLGEIGRLAADPATMPEADSWAEPFGRRGSWRERFRLVRSFVERYWQLRARRVVSLGPPPATASAMQFEVLRYSREESEAMKRRAEPVTGGIFALPWFLAVAMRAHAAILRARGVVEGALECAIAVQGRNRGARGPIFQNQVSQLFFSQPLDAMENLPALAGELQQQFAGMMRAKCDVAFVIMVDWMRRLPAWAYRRFLRREASGQIVSFYHAHTGQFLPGVEELAGSVILDGWHIPSVPQPPGSGLFFSERAGCLTGVVCWREGVMNWSEQKMFQASVCGDLRGAETVVG